MSLDDERSLEDAREAEIDLDGKLTLRGEVIKGVAGDLILKLTGRQIADLQKLKGSLTEEGEPVAVLMQISDKASKQLLQRGQTVFAWVRVKRNDQSFATRTALFSLGAVAAVTITRQAIRHYKSR